MLILQKFPNFVKEMTQMDIGGVIKKYRKEAGFTQEEMAKRLGVTTPAVNKWENGNSKPDIEGAYCQTFGYFS